MKVFKLKISTLLVVLAVLVGQTIFAQRGGMHQRGNDEALQAELGLTDAQKEEIKTIKTAYKEKYKTLKSKSAAERAATKEAFKSLKDAERAAIEEILTDEQRATLEKKKAEKEAMRAANKEKRKEVKMALEEYRKTNITPVLKAQRAKLDEAISAEDQAIIAELRASFETKKASIKADKAKGKKSNKATRKEAYRNDEDRKVLKTLVEKYNDSIENLFAEIKPQQEKWKADQKSIMEAHKPEKAEERKMARGKKQGMRGKKGHQKARKPFGPAMKKSSFLLLEPK